MTEAAGRFAGDPDAVTMVPRRGALLTEGEAIHFDMSKTPAATRIARCGLRWAAWATLPGDGDWRELPWFHVGTYWRRKRAERELVRFAAFAQANADASIAGRVGVTAASNRAPLARMQESLAEATGEIGWCRAEIDRLHAQRDALMVQVARLCAGPDTNRSMERAGLLMRIAQEWHRREHHQVPSESWQTCPGWPCREVELLTRAAGGDREDITEC